MRPSIRLALSALLASTVTTSATAGDDVGPYGIDFHISAPSYAGCDARSDDAASCATQNPNGVAASGAMWVWVFVSGVPEATPAAAGDPWGIRALSFGLSYESLGFADWTGCHGGTEDPQDDAEGTWPESGTGLTVTWPDDCHEVTGNDDGLTAVGILTVGTDESGLLDVVTDPRVGYVRATDCVGTGFRVCDERLGRADVAVGGTGGVVACDETCSLVPTRSGSWSSVKAVFGH